METELLASLPTAELAIIELDKNSQSIEWEEKDKEFYLDGKLYDVQKKVIENGKTFLYCLNDVKEEQLLKEMGNVAQPGSDKQKNKLSLKVITDYCLAETAEKILVPTKALHHSFFYFDETALAATIEINVPPPRA